MSDPYAYPDTPTSQYFRHWGQICLKQYHFTNDNPLGPNIFFLSIFAAALQPQIFLAIKHRTLSTGIFLTIGILLEILGYVGYVYNSIDATTYPYTLISFSTSFLKTAFYTAGIYCVLARLIVVFDGDDAADVKAAKLRPRTYTLLFLTSSSIILVLNAVAVGMLLSGRGFYERTIPLLRILLASESLQVLFLLAFIGVSTHLGLKWRSKSKQGTLNKKYAAIYQCKEFKRSIYALVVATLALFVRSIYRLIMQAYTQSTAYYYYGSEPIVFKKATFFVLDGTMMGLLCLALTVFYPGAAFGGDIWREGSAGFFGKKFGGGRKNAVVHEDGVRTEVGSFESVRKEVARTEVVGVEGGR